MYNQNLMHLDQKTKNKKQNKNTVSVQRGACNMELFMMHNLRTFCQWYRILLQIWFSPTQNYINPNPSNFSCWFFFLILIDSALYSLANNAWRKPQLNDIKLQKFSGCVILYNCILFEFNRFRKVLIIYCTHLFGFIIVPSFLTQNFLFNIILVFWYKHSKHENYYKCRFLFCTNSSIQVHV